MNDESAAPHQNDELDAEELADADGEVLPDREVMSVISAPGDTVTILPVD